MDLCWLIMERQRSGQSTDAAKMAAWYREFDTRRLKYNSQPEELIRSRRKNAVADKQLYEYINAFRIQGATAANIRLRAIALQAFFDNVSGRI